MGRGIHHLLPFSLGRTVAALVLCALLALVHVPAQAQETFEPGSICHVSVKSSVSYEDAASKPADWTCEGAEFDWHAERHIIRHDLSNATGEAANPRFAEFSRYEFERLTVRVEGEDGHAVSRAFSFRDLKLGPSSLKAMVELPDPGSRVTSVVMIHEGGWFPESFVTATLSQEAKVPAIAGYLHILAAILCGLLLAPVIFDLVFFKALREPFPLYHALFCLMAFVQTASVSGLLPMMLPVSYTAELNITYLSLDVMVAATFLFAYHFIEDGRLPRRFRRWLLVLPLVTIVNGLVTTFKMEWFGYWIDHYYFGVLVSIFVAYFYILHLARKQGSRMAPYLIFGIAPLFAIVVLQGVAVAAMPNVLDFDETWPQNFALLFEVVATALAVADRFMMIRRERDQAVDAARDLEMLSELDELTGLRNRRALEAHFAELVRQGFHAMAVVDLDHFKSINDIHGHPVGDRVIRSAAWALSPGDDADLAAFRIGGEEFILLLRGEDAATKAENRRKAITARIMAEVDELHRPVTASVGYVDFADSEEDRSIDFLRLYARADQLLYEAKCEGRNRMLSGELELAEGLGDPGRRAAAA
ncbi:GGDEF domain-containing protein [Qipengyuania sp. 1NDH17]|uniref:diguanylate cyclase n=1 Tax=Qipengyuania polymorpha TaxID=2867234 RepID=A0ABS7J1R6_9SPHN|nr:diguanylate cyclase [Qipengyuania polymorpha]MBX7458490.1 GGDEF domain-containing protein [Qipengyuania polymorpha]